MGLFKSIKKAFKKVGKVFKKIGKAVKKALKNKWVRFALIAAATVFGVGLLAGATYGTIFSTGISTIGQGISGVASSISGAFSGATAGATGAAATQSAVIPGITANAVNAGVAAAAPSVAGVNASAIGSGIAAGAAPTASTGLLASAGKGLAAIGSAAKASPIITSSLLTTGAQAASGYAQGKQRDDELKQLEEEQNSQTMYGVRYDGQGNPVNTGDSLLAMAKQYGGAPQAQQAQAPAPKRVIFDGKTNQWVYV